MNDNSQTQSIAAGVFEDSDRVSKLIPKLRALGIKAEEISIFSTNEQDQERFAPYLDESLQTEEDSRLSTAGKAGLGLGGATALATLATSAGTSIFVIGAFSGFAILGTFIALMMSRGVEKEAADFFEQELQAGRILVAVEVSGDDAEQRLQQAEETISNAGGRSFELPEG